MPRKSSFLLLFHFCTGTSLGKITGMHLHIYTGANMELLCLNKKKTKQKLSSRKSRQMFCQKRKKRKKKKRFVLVSVRTCAYKYQSYWDYKYTHTEAPDKAVGLAQGLMAAGLTGSQPGWQVVRGSVEARASLRVSSFLSKRRRWRAQTSTESGAQLPLRCMFALAYY